MFIAFLIIQIKTFISIISKKKNINYAQMRLNIIIILRLKHFNLFLFLF
jgi:hypothetical protein